MKISDKRLSECSMIPKSSVGILGERGGSSIVTLVERKVVTVSTTTSTPCFMYSECAPTDWSEY